MDDKQTTKIKDEQLLPMSLLNAYCNGYFPMAEQDGEIYWYKPEDRAIFPLKEMKFSRSLMQTIRKGIFEYSYNKNFEQVMFQCANTRKNETWISNDMFRAYNLLHQIGYAHSVEVWQDGQLVGGLYGVAVNGMFCGESMFNP